MEVQEIAVEGYEKVIRGLDAEAGLHALIAVHDTTLGPSLGGMRLLPYPSEQDALTDVLRLARGMTYKSAVADTGLGGGKAVIIADPADKSPDLFRAMGRLVETLDGRYITAEDMNVRPDDLRHVRETTRWVTGLPADAGGSGNPSPITALGVFHGMKAALAETFGSPDFGGRRILIQGVGSVGSRLAVLLGDAGATVTICDLAEARAAELAAEHGFELVPNDAWLDVDCDVYSPCALGATLSQETIPKLRCRAVAGAANNQLAQAGDDESLAERGILYAPDYVINAGGIINVATEIDAGGYREEEARRRVEGIESTLLRIFRLARERGITPGAAADALAIEKLESARAARAS